MNGNTNCLLSICCLGYNHEQFIKDNIYAIWNSDYKNIEIIVLDDGSKDNSAKILKELQKESPYPMKVILQDNTGNIGHNLNVLIKESKGDFISFISLDDVLYSNKIKKCIDKLIENPYLAFVASSQIDLIDKNKKIISTFREKLDEYTNIKIEDLLELEYTDFYSFYIQGAFFRKSIVNNVSGFDEDMTGDDIILRTKIFRYMINNPKYQFEIIKEPFVCYRFHENNISKNYAIQLKIMTEYFQRYWPDRKIPNNLINEIFINENITIGVAFKILFMSIKTFSLLKNRKIIKIIIKKIGKKIEKFFLKKIVSDYSYINLEIHGDERGSLISIENLKNIPFKIKRVYYIFGTNENVIRGQHTHKKLKQLLVCVSGSVCIYLETKNKKETILLDSPNKAILLDGLVWREMKNFSKNTVLLVLANDFYNESDYIRNYDKFLKKVKKI